MAPAAKSVIRIRLVMVHLEFCFYEISELQFSAYLMLCIETVDNVL